VLRLTPPAPEELLTAFLTVSTCMPLMRACSAVRWSAAPVWNAWDNNRLKKVHVTLTRFGFLGKYNSVPILSAHYVFRKAPNSLLLTCALYLLWVRSSLLLASSKVRWAPRCQPHQLPTSATTRALLTVVVQY
jgi:hypothetical protein